MLKNPNNGKVYSLALYLYRSKKYFVPVQTFWARPKVELNIVLIQKLNLLDGNHLLIWHKTFRTSTIFKSIFGLA